MQGMARLMDLMQDQEAIRNETLLLLVHLTQSRDIQRSEDIQKIVAFEGAFESLLRILADEGFCGGGMLVQVCGVWLRL
jgi:intracellular protein transport protein USO1